MVQGFNTQDILWPRDFIEILWSRDFIDRTSYGPSISDRISYGPGIS
jgi:hypothetical protein